MEDSTRNLLASRIEKEFSNLDTIDDMDVKTKTINNLVQLYKLKIEEEKIDTEYAEHCDRCEMETEKHQSEIDLKKEQLENERNRYDSETSYKMDQMANEVARSRVENELKKCQIDKESEDRKAEIELKQAQLDEQKIDRWVNFGMQVGLAMVSVFAYDIWNRRGLKFEETGTITSPMTRNLLSKMLPKR